MVLGNFILALAKVIDIIVGVYTFIVAGSVIISWVRPDPYNPIVRFLHLATEPLFSRCRRLLPRLFYKGGLDWTPLIVIIALVFIEILLVGTLTDIGLKLRK